MKCSIHMVNYIIYTISSICLNIFLLKLPYFCYLDWFLILLQSHYLGTYLCLDPWNSFVFLLVWMAVLWSLYLSPSWLTVFIEYIHLAIVTPGSKVIAMSEILVIFPLNEPKSWITLIPSGVTISQCQYLRITGVPIKLEFLGVASRCQKFLKLHRQFRCAAGIQSH